MGEALKKAAVTTAEATTENTENVGDNDFRPFDLEKLYGLKKIKADLYIKLSEKNFVKVFNNGDMEHHPVLDKYKAKGVDKIFVSKLDFQKIFNLLSTRRMLQLKVASDNNDIIQCQLQTVEEVQTYLTNIGVDPQVMEVVNQSVKSTIKALSKEENIADMIKNLKKGSGYAHTHSVLTTHLACAIAKQMGWEDQKVFDKLSYASIMHNVAIPHDKLAVIQNLMEPQSEVNYELSMKEVEMVKNHIKDVIKIVDKTENFPSEAIAIILDHHEKPDGSGGPRHLQAKHTPAISCVFILAHDMARYIILEENNEIKNILQAMQPTYSLGNYKRPFEALLESLKITLESLPR